MSRVAERPEVARRSSVKAKTRVGGTNGAAAKAATQPVLACEGLDVYYGSVQILFGVDFTVEQGEVVALLGTNGAGKSTLLRAITGLTPPKRGRVWFNGEEITGHSPVELAHKGMSFMPGGRGIFPGLSVGENLRMAGWLFRNDAKQLNEATESALELFPVLRKRLDSKAALLSGGQQQMLTLAQSFMASPKLLMIDELSLGLAPVVVGELFDVVRRISDSGVTIVIVEQSVNVSLELAERAVFMEKGEVRFTGPTSDLLGRDDLLRSVFIGGAAGEPTEEEPVKRNGARGSGSRRSGVGTKKAEVLRRAQQAHAPLVLSARGVTKRFGGLTAVDGVDLDIREGEIVGVIGANGAGKTTLFDLLTGFVPLDSGSVHLGTKDVTNSSPNQRAYAGLARSFQDARLFPGLTTFENLAVAREPFLLSREPIAALLRLPASLLSEALVAERVEQLIEALGLGAFRDKYVSDLSTGSRRILELACLLAQEPDILLLDEPSAGIAQRESEALGPLLKKIRDVTGATIAIVEHDVPLLLATCDRLVAMELGRVIADGDPNEVIADPQVIASYLGGDPIAVQRSGGTGSGGSASAKSKPQPKPQPKRRPSRTL